MGWLYLHLSLFHSILNTTMSVLRYIENIVNLAKIIATLPVAGIGLAIASIWHERSADPPQITNGATPVLLIHGSESNQQQFLFFRRALASEEVGHIFTINLNKRPRYNDKDRDILDYAVSVHTKLQQMRDLYASSGFDMSEVILVGNSMGGLIAAAYCVSDTIAEKVEVAALISISTPWKGSWLADIFCSADQFPQKYFRRQSEDRIRLVTTFVKYARETQLPVYNYGSIFDMHVPPTSAQLDFLPQWNRLIDSRNDHLTTMLDGTLARYISDNWIAPNTVYLDTIRNEEEAGEQEQETGKRFQEALLKSIKFDETKPLRTLEDEWSRLHQRASSKTEQLPLSQTI